MHLLAIRLFGNSIDCGDVNNLGNGLNIHVKQPAISEALANNCCDVGTGVTCTNGRVVGIDWGFLSLNGTINATAIPTTLTSLQLHFNSISGGFPAFLPNTLLTFMVAANNLDGNLPTNLPTIMQMLNLNFNQMTGNVSNLPISLKTILLDLNRFSGLIPAPLPLGLEIISFSGNIFTESIPDFPNTLTFINLELNYLTGKIPTLPSGLESLKLYHNILVDTLPFPLPIGLKVFDVGYNQLVGQLQGPLPVGLIFLNLEINLLNGTLPLMPVTLIELRLSSGNPQRQFYGSIELMQPTILRIVGNSISDLVVNDSSLLSSCDISDNPLLFENVHILNLGSCYGFQSYFTPLSSTLNSSNPNGTPIQPTHSSYTSTMVGINEQTKFHSGLVSTANSDEFNSRVNLTHFSTPNIVLIDVSLRNIITMGVKYTISLGLLIYVVIKVPKRLFKKIKKTKDTNNINDSWL